MSKTMTYKEMQNWMLYFRKHPIGRSEDYRAYFTGSCSGNLPKGSKPGDYFPSLKSNITPEEGAFDFVEEVTKIQEVENAKQPT